MPLTIKSNHQYRDFIYLNELTDEERGFFDHYEEHEDATFFKYKGMLYDLSDFMSIERSSFRDSELSDWDGYHSEGCWSGVLVKINEYDHTIKIGRYYS